MRQNQVRHLAWALPGTAKFQTLRPRQKRRNTPEQNSCSAGKRTTRHSPAAQRKHKTALSAEKNWRHTPNQAFGKNGKAKHFVLGTTEKPNTSLWETWAANASLFNNSCAARSDKTPWPALGTHSVQLRPKGRRRYPQWCWRFGWFNVLQTLKLWNGEKLKVWIFENFDGLKLWKTWKFDILIFSMF